MNRFILWVRSVFKVSTPKITRLSQRTYDVVTLLCNLLIVLMNWFILWVGSFFHFGKKLLHPAVRDKIGKYWNICNSEDHEECCGKLMMLWHCGAASFIVLMNWFVLWVGPLTVTPCGTTSESPKITRTLARNLGNFTLVSIPFMVLMNWFTLWVCPFSVRHPVVRDTIGGTKERRALWWMRATAAAAMLPRDGRKRRRMSRGKTGGMWNEALLPGAYNKRVRARDLTVRLGEWTFKGD